MRSILLSTYFLFTLYCLCFGIGNTDLKEVYSRYKHYIDSKDYQNAYSLLSQQSKAMISEDEFIKYQQGKADSNRSTTIEEKIDVKSVDDSRYRRLRFDSWNINTKDTIHQRYYRTFIIENNKWLLVWTNTLFDQADIYYDNQKYQDAKRIYHRILDIDPYNANACDGIAGCYNRGELPSDRIKDSILCYAKKSIKIEPDVYNHYSFLSLCYGMQHGYKAAIKCLEKQLGYCLNRQDSTVVLTNTALYYESLHEFDKSKALYLNVLNKDSTYTHGLWLLGKLYATQKRNDSAFTYLYRAYQSVPMNNYLQVQLLYDLSLVSYRVRRYDIAEESVLKALVIVPNNEQARQFYDVWIKKSSH